MLFIQLPSIKLLTQFADQLQRQHPSLISAVTAEMKRSEASTKLVQWDDNIGTIIGTPNMKLTTYNDVLLAANGGLLKSKTLVFL